MQSDFTVRKVPYYAQLNLNFLTLGENRAKNRTKAVPID